MIVVVGSNKGSPGATTLALTLAACWSTPRVMCELDPRGADLPLRLPGADGRPLAMSPSIATLAVDARPGAARRPLEQYAQATSLGVPVICGETSARRFHRLAAHLPAVTAAMKAWPGTVIADLGCLQPWNPALLVASAADLLLLVTGTDTASLAHLRDRVDELAEETHTPERSGDPVIGVVVRAGRRDHSVALSRVRKLLASVGSPASVVGVVVDDAKTATTLWSGQLTARAARSPLMSAARTISNAATELTAAHGGAPTATAAAAPATSTPASAEPVPLGTSR